MVQRHVIQIPKTYHTYHPPVITKRRSRRPNNTRRTAKMHSYGERAGGGNYTHRIQHFHVRDEPACFRMNGVIDYWCSNLVFRQMHEKYELVFLRSGEKIGGRVSTTEEGGY